jgi:tryptophan synthase beta chain
VTSDLSGGAAGSVPDASGHFDRFGGRFVPEALYAALLQLEREFLAAMADPDC